MLFFSIPDIKHSHEFLKAPFVLKVLPPFLATIITIILFLVINTVCECVCIGERKGLPDDELLDIVYPKMRGSFGFIDLRSMSPMEERHAIERIKGMNERFSSLSVFTIVDDACKSKFHTTQRSVMEVTFIPLKDIERLSDALKSFGEHTMWAEKVQSVKTSMEERLLDPNMISRHILRHIPGISGVDIDMLLNTFHCIRRIIQASQKELEKCLKPRKARQLHAFFVSNRELFL
jgi:hypothetical protein